MVSLGVKQKKYTLILLRNSPLTFVVSGVSIPSLPLILEGEAPDIDNLSILNITYLGPER